MHLLKLSFAIFSLGFKLFKRLCLFYWLLLGLNQLIKYNPEQNAVEKDYLSKPVNSFIESNIFWKFFDTTKTLLLNDYAVHCDFKSIEAVA